MRLLNNIFFIAIILVRVALPQGFAAEGYCKDPSHLHMHIETHSALSYDSIDIKHYSINLNVAVSPVYITGYTGITFTSKTAGLTRSIIDLSNSMTVDSVTEGGVPVLFTHTNGQIRVSLGSPAALNETRTIKVYYRGLPTPTGFGSFGYSTGSTPFIWTLSQPYGAKDWWPCKNSPDDKADSAEINITVPPGLTAVSNGLLMGRDDNGDGTHTFRWKTSYPIASYLIAVTISEFSLYIQYYKYSPSDSMRVDHYLPPAVLSANKINIDKTTDMLTLYSRLFGQYPFIREKYGHVLFGRGGGMEHQTISSMGGFDEYLIAHELAHQWFGDKITCRDWNNIWLNEGFASYCEALYFENTGGKGSYRYIMDRFIDIAKTATGTVYVQSNLSDPFYIFNYARTYAKGAVILHMLRGMMGDSLFFRSVRGYINDPVYSYSTITTDEFRAVMERESGFNLDYFFDQWVYKEGYPSFKVDWAKEKSEGGLWRVSLMVMQPAGNIFKMPVNVKIVTETGDTTFTVMCDAQAQMFTFLIKGEPKDFLFDPDNFVMKEIESETKPGIDNEFKPFILRQNYPNPFTTSTTLRLVVNQSGNYVLKIYNSLGKECGELYSGYLQSGIYPFAISGESFKLSSGVYFVRAESGKVSEWVKMVWVK